MNACSRDGLHIVNLPSDKNFIAPDNVKKIHPKKETTITWFNSVKGSQHLKNEFEAFCDAQDQ